MVQNLFPGETGIASLQFLVETFLYSSLENPLVIAIRNNSSFNCHILVEAVCQIGFTPLLALVFVLFLVFCGKRAAMDDFLDDLMVSSRNFLYLFSASWMYVSHVVI